MEQGEGKSELRNMTKCLALEGMGKAGRHYGDTSSVVCIGYLLCAEVRNMRREREDFWPQPANSLILVYLGDIS